MATIKFKYDGKSYESKPFDFKAMCLVNEGHNDENRKGPLMMCHEAVKYMFEGTEAPLNEIKPGAMAKLCTAVWNIYIAELSEKND